MGNKGWAGVMAHPICVRGSSRDGLDLCEYGREDVRGVVGHLFLEDAGDALHAHAGVHVLGRQRLQAGVLLPVVLRGDCSTQADSTRASVLPQVQQYRLSC